jgi:hypothetical protein
MAGLLAGMVPSALAAYMWKDISKAQQFDQQDPVNPTLNNQLVGLQAAPVNTLAGKARVRHEGEVPEFFSKPTSAPNGIRYTNATGGLNVANYNRAVMLDSSMPIFMNDNVPLARVNVGGAPKQTTYSDSLVNTTLITPYRTKDKPYYI